MIYQIHTYLLRSTLNNQIQLKQQRINKIMYINVKLFGLVEFPKRIHVDYIFWAHQQIYMSIQFAEKASDSSGSTPIRVEQISVPTSYFVNRKKPEFLTEIPQGLEYFQPSHKKMFDRIGHKSTIEEHKIFTHPERYPFQNKIANDINYHRSLNTIDIEGANTNSKRSMGVKNRIKAQEQLMREKDNIFTPILFNGLSEDEKRRRIAEQRLLKQSRDIKSKSIQRNYQSQQKLSPQYDSLSPNIKFNRKEIGKTITDKLADERLQSKQQIVKDSNPQLRRYDLLQKESLLQLLENGNRGEKIFYPNSQAYANGASRDGLSRGSSMSKISSELQQIFNQERKNIELELQKKELRNQLRQLNPTNLSHVGNSNRNSGIFATLGKNISSN